MNSIIFPIEDDFKRWIKEAVKELIEEVKQSDSGYNRYKDNLWNRKEAAVFLRISLVTLNDWVKRGMPSHKQRGRVYFDKKEVINYIMERKDRQLKMGSKLFHLKREII